MIAEVFIFVEQKLESPYEYMKYKIPFAGRGHKYNQKEIELVSLVMQYAIPLTQGKYLEKFQKSFCDYIDTIHLFRFNYFEYVI